MESVDSSSTHLLKLEQVIVDGMRLVIGATAKSSIAKLYEETDWMFFVEKRDKDKAKEYLLALRTYLAHDNHKGVYDKLLRTNCYQDILLRFSIVTKTFC